MLISPPQLKQHLANVHTSLYVIAGDEPLAKAE